MHRILINFNSNVIISSFFLKLKLDLFNVSEGKLNVDFFDTDPKTDPAQEETLSSEMVTEVTMTLSIYSIMEKPAKRQRTENLDLPSICQVKIVAWGSMFVSVLITSNFRAKVY